MPLPRIIHVETRARCNGTCAFCAAAVGTDSRDDVSMPDVLIGKVIDELASLKYANRLSLYNNNEPFLDKRIFDIIKLSRDKLPCAYLELKSNGLALTTEKILKMFNAGLDMLYINDYTANGKYHKNVLKIKEDLKQLRRFKGYLEGEQYFTRIKIELRDKNEVIGNRAGTSPNSAYDDSPLQRTCFRPFEMMTISPEGKVSVCSEDFYYSINMGNVKHQSLNEIWMSEKWNAIRRKLIFGDRGCLTACAKCDYKGFTYEMLKEHELGYKWTKHVGKIQHVIKKSYNLLKCKAEAKPVQRT